ncbi:swr1 complex component [Coemansia javaensis]|uniref:Swr1 complex component n=1 Tax=Coemansia javaensis TaxID=2761396 RepID=A0A9W8HDG2_9FUNG|nr:swr1 complex component [Coemansia javaensis]
MRSRGRGIGRPARLGPASDGSSSSGSSSSGSSSSSDEGAAPAQHRPIDPAVFARQAARASRAAEARLTEYLESFVTLPDDTVLTCLEQPKRARRAPGAMTVPDRPQRVAGHEAEARRQRGERLAQMAADRQRWVEDTARAMNRISELRRRGMLRDSGDAGAAGGSQSLPPAVPEPEPQAREPGRAKTWWDRLLADAVSRHREMGAAARRRRVVLRKCSRQIAREDDERKARLGIYKRPELAERAERALRQRLAKLAAQHVMRRWSYVRSVVEEQRQMEEEEARSREDKKALFAMLQRSTQLLAEQRAGRDLPSSGSESDDDQGSKSGDHSSSSGGSGGGSSSEATDEEADGQGVGTKALLGGRQSPVACSSSSSTCSEPRAAETAVAETVQAQPALLRGTLREYQRQGLAWLASLHQQQTNGILADEMGLGKTIQTIALLAHLACDRGIWGPHLIIVPTSVVLNWEQELHRWVPGFKVLTYYGSRAERKERRRGWSRANAVHVCVTSYQLAIQDASVFRRKAWYYMVLDEAQAIKNFRSQRWQTLLAFRSSARLLLTGTPLQNTLMELWSLMYFLMPREFGADGEADGCGFAGLDRFREWFAQPLDRLLAARPEIAAPVAAQGAVAFNAAAFLRESGTGADDALRQTHSEAQQAVHKLHAVLRPHILRRLKRDVETQLPQKTEHVVRCHMSKRQRQLYDDFMSRSQTRATLSGGTYVGVMGVLMQLRKVCNHPDLFETRPVVTSWAMSGAGVARYRATEDLVRRMLDPPQPQPPQPLLLAPSGECDDVRARVRDLDAAPLLLRRALQAAHAALAIVATEEKSWGELQLRPRESRLRSVAASARHRRLAEAQRSSGAWARLFALNRARVAGAGPLYGAGALRAARVVRSVGERLAGCSAAAAAALAPTGAQLLARHRATIARFVFATPRVVVVNTRPALEAVHPHLRPERRGAWLEDLAPNVLHVQRRVAHRTGALRPLEVRQQIAFPEPFLLQYDCGKLQVLARLLRRLVRAGHRVLIFTQMTRMLDVLETWLNLHAYRYLRLDGATPVEQRWRLTEQFNHDDRWSVFISSTRAGGLGINLTGADSVVFYDSDWNHAMDAQCQDRCHRIGQQREVHIYRLITDRSVEEAIWRKQCEKRWLDDVVIQQGHFDPNRPPQPQQPPPPPQPQPQPQQQSLGASDWYDLAAAVLHQQQQPSPDSGTTAPVLRVPEAQRTASAADSLRELAAAEDEADAVALKAAIAEVAQADALDLGDDYTPPPPPPPPAVVADNGGSVPSVAADDSDRAENKHGDEDEDEDGIGHIDDYMLAFVTRELDSAD